MIWAAAPGALGLLLLEREEKLELTGVEVEPAAAELAGTWPSTGSADRCSLAICGTGPCSVGYFDLVVSTRLGFEKGAGIPAASAV